MSTQREFYEELRDIARRELGKSCNKTKCGHRAFTHDHRIWVDDYVEWLVRVAVLTDCLEGFRPTRSVIAFMAEHPPENLENVRAQRRAA